MTTMELELPVPMPIGRDVELSLIERAPSDRRSPAVRKRLAALLVGDNQFDRARAELELLADPLDFQALFLAGTCDLVDELEASNRRAAELFGSAAALARTANERASALAEEAKCLVRLGDDAKARQRLESALELEPGHHNAWKRLASMELRTGHADRLVERTATKVSEGIAHPTVLSARTLALCATGRVEEAIAFQAMATLTSTSHCAPPDGWGTIEAFNAELTAELLALAGSRREHYGLASINSLRVDQPMTTSARAFPALLETIRAEVVQHARLVSAADHPLAVAAPRKAFLRAWAVITDGTGFETWHVHQNGWLTGVYYVAVPAGLDESTGSAGCLEFGLPDTLIGVEPPADAPSTLLRPEPGLLSISPSHAYHRTYPHERDEWRICVAFDVVPLP